MWNCKYKIISIGNKQSSMIIRNSHKDSTEKLTSDGLDECIFRQKHKAELWCPQPAPICYIITYSACQHVTCDTYCIKQFDMGWNYACMPYCLHGKRRIRFQLWDCIILTVRQHHSQHVYVTTWAVTQDSGIKTNIGLLFDHVQVPHSRWCCVDG
jgi:hypothetical protein